MTAEHHCTPEHLYDLMRKPSRFAETVKDSEHTAQEVRDGLDVTYTPIGNQGTLLKAQALIDEKGLEQARRMVLDEDKPTALTYALGQDLMRRLQNEGRYEDAIEIVEHISAQATQQGQAIQALSIWNRLTPEGALRYAQRIAKKQGKTLDPELVEEIHQKANDLKKAKNQNERQVKAAKLKAAIQKANPPSIWKKLVTVQTMGQLLNPKTAIRNVVGNGLFSLFQSTASHEGG